MSYWGKIVFNLSFISFFMPNKNKIDCLKLINFIEKSNFFTTNTIQNKKLLIAFSGGQDSTCLLTIFYILSKKWNFQLGAIYCNHGWENSIEISLAVFENLQRFGIPFYFVDSPNSIPMKPEQEARNWRYSSFYKILKWENYDFLLTGHTLSDCAETALFNLVRGSGLKGICSLKEFQTFEKFEKNNFLFKKTIFFADSFFYFTKKNENFFLIKYHFFKKISSSLIFFKTLRIKCFEKNTNLNYLKKTSEFFKFFVSRSKKLVKTKPKLFLLLPLQKQGSKKHRPNRNFFNLYLTKIHQFQKIDNGSSFITFFKPNFLEKNLKNSDVFFNPSIQNLITKKKKEKFPLPYAFGVRKVVDKEKGKAPGISKAKVLQRPPRDYPYRINFFNFGLNTLHGKKRKTFSENFFLSFRKKSYIGKIKLPKNQNFLIFRPFLKINRETLFLFSKNLKLSFHYDPSNKDLNISRNYIRKVLIPLIKKLNPRVEENIYKFSRILQFYSELVDDLKCPPDRFDIFSP